MSELHDRRTICSDHKRRCGWRIATLPVPGCGRVPTNTVYTRGIHSRVTEVHSGGFEKRCTCHLAAAPLIIMRRAYLPSDDGGPTWRWARCAYSYFLFRRLLTGDSTDGTSAIVPPSWTCPASFLDDATRKGWREEKKNVRTYEKTEFEYFRGFNLPITIGRKVYDIQMMSWRNIVFLSFAFLPRI